MHIEPFLLRTAPQAGESLSSWLVRVSHRFTYRPYAFCLLLWRGVAILTRDIDGQSNPVIWKSLAYANGVTEDDAFATTVASMKDVIFEKHVPNGKTKWLLRLGIFHRSRRLFGQQFCARCLANDAIPYYRLSWRFAYSIVCSTHRSLLTDRCQICGHPVEFHRTDPDKQSIIHCFNCQARLDRQQTVRASAPLIHLQGYLDSAIANRHVRFGTKVDYPSIDLFAIYSQLLRVVSTGSRSQQLRDVLAIRYGFDPAPIDFQSNAREFETLDLNNRARLAMMCAPLLLEWPDRFIDVCRRANFWMAWATKDRLHLPPEYMQVVTNHLSGQTAKRLRSRSSKSVIAGQVKLGRLSITDQKGQNSVVHPFNKLSYHQARSGFYTSSLSIKRCIEMIPSIVRRLPAGFHSVK